MKILLVTISIGDKYLEVYNRLFRNSHEKYANKHGYDLKVITDYLDDTYKQHNISLYFQKVLVCNQEWSSEYDYIIYIDSDIYININSPPIHSYYDFGTKIGIVDEWSQPSSSQKTLLAHFWNMNDKSIADYYVNTLSISREEANKMPFVVNSGVIVYQPSIHREKMNEFYQSYMPIAMNYQFIWFEQASLALFLVKNDMYFQMDTKFNAVWNWTRTFNEMTYIPENLVDYFQENYFIHFAGRTSYEKIPTLHRFNVLHGEKIADYDPEYITCCLGSTPHMAYALDVVGARMTPSPFDWIISNPKDVINCINDNFSSFLDKVIQIDPFDSYKNDIDEGKGNVITYMDFINNKSLYTKDANKCYVETVASFRSILSSSKHVKFFIISNLNRTDTTDFHEFERRLIELTDTIRNHTNNFMLYAFYIVRTSHEHYMKISNHPNLEIRTMYMFSNSNGLRFADIHDNIWFKNILSDLANHS